LPNKVEPLWLPAHAVIAINESEVAATGENFAVLRHELLESALHRPIHRFAYEDEGDIAALAVSLLTGIAANHPFEQGNKRTAFFAALLFMNINGYRLEAPDNRRTSQLIIDVITGDQPEDALVDLFRSNLIAIED
jgi:death-on-curing protein